VAWQVLEAWQQATADRDALNASPVGSSYLGPVRLAADALLHLTSGDLDGALERFAHARSRAADRLLSTVVCGRIEVLAWHDAGEPARMADAASWLLQGASECPSALALGFWAQARAGVRDPADALGAARRAGDRTVLWRVCALAAERAEDQGDRREADRLRQEARGIVEALIDSLDDDGVRAGFAASAEITTLLGGERRPELT
jgi:hypothetical protein